MQNIFGQIAKCVFVFAPPTHHRQQSLYMANILKAVFVQFANCNCPICKVYLLNGKMYFFKWQKCIILFAPPTHYCQQSQYMVNILKIVLMQLAECSCPKVQTVSVLIAKCICSSCQLLSVTQSPTSASRANTGKGIQPPDDQKKKAVHSLQPFLPPSAQPSFGPEPPNISTDKSYQPKWSLRGNH